MYNSHWTAGTVAAILAVKFVVWKLGLSVDSSIRSTVV